MYKELIKELREMASFPSLVNDRYTELMKEAANAIETLQEENRFLKNMQKQLASSVDKRELGNMVRGALNGAERT